MDDHDPQMDDHEPQYVDANVEPAKDLDYVAIDHDDNLLVEFSATGIKKQFMRINLRSIVGYGSNTYAHSAYVEQMSADRFSLLFESQDFDYSHKPHLRTCVIEQFRTDDEARSALKKIKGVLGQDRVKAVPGSSSTQASRRPDTKEKAAIMLMVVSAVAIILGGAGMFMGGIALFQKFYN